MELTSFETAIKAFLDNFIKEDPDPDFIEKYNNPKKSIKECCQYIMKEVEKSRKGNARCVAVADDEVYGLAIHYYDEEDLVVEQPKSVTEVKAPAPVAKPEPAAEPAKKERKPRAKKEKAVEVQPEEDIFPAPLEIPIF